MNFKALSWFRAREAHWGDQVFLFLLRLVGWALIALMLGFFWQLFGQAAPVFNRLGFAFFSSQDWDPVSENFGALSFVYGTLATSLLACLISVPISVGGALFLTELAPKKTANFFGFLIEMLAAIPSVVYGLWGVFVLAPWVRTSLAPFLAKWLGFLPFFQGPSYGVGLFTAALLLAIMITPTIASLCREVFRSVPLLQREAALALGATRWESIRLGVLKSSTSGILGAVALGLGRALGETMAVTMVVGNRADISWSVFAPAQTMASVIANEFAEAQGEQHWAALAALGVTLLGVSLIIHGVSRVWMKRLMPSKARVKPRVRVSERVRS
jgi:phosphate transport system permease protein